MPPSRTLSRSSPADAEALRAPLEALLGALCRDPEAHARFLNTLSLLEHVGSRKIMASQSPGPLSEEVLRHLSEETRHAHFFRRAAERVAGRPLSYRDADLLAPAASRMYFGRLDAGISSALGSDRPLAYFYVTLAVETRALWLYGSYQRLLAERGIPLSLSGVLAEEDAHLAGIGAELARRDPACRRRGEAFSRLESGLFSGWLSALTAAAKTHRIPGCDGR